MRIGVYAFAGSGDMQKNFTAILRGITTARRENLRLLVFHECALSGYPPMEIDASKINYVEVEQYMARICTLAREGGLYIAIGTTMRAGKKVFNCMRLAGPDGVERTPYAKRALWGWDRDNFAEGNYNGIYTIDDLKIGLRLCFEVRFPEYFRELYRAGAALAVVSFCDTQPAPKPERYELMCGILQTRAMENLLPVLAVNNTRAYPSAPCAYFDRNGYMVSTLAPGTEGMLSIDFKSEPFTFGEQGRAFFADRLSELPPEKRFGKES